MREDILQMQLFGYEQVANADCEYPLDYDFYSHSRRIKVESVIKYKISVLDWELWFVNADIDKAQIGKKFL